MSIAALPTTGVQETTKVLRRASDFFFSCNRYALVSAGLTTLFILYFILPSVATRAIPGSGFIFIILLPLAAMLASIHSLRQIASNHEKGRALSIYALAISSGYFMMALAIPLMLALLYVVYSYVI